MYTGNWTISYVPSTASVSDDNISVGMYVQADGTLAAIPSGTNSSNFLINAVSNPGSDAVIYANGTSNPIVAYVTKDGILQMAQMK